MRSHAGAEIGAELEDAVATAVSDSFVWAYQRAEAPGRNWPAPSPKPAWTPSNNRISARARWRNLGEFKALAAGRQADQDRPQDRHRDA